MLGTVPILYVLIYCGIYTRKKILPNFLPADNSEE